MRNSPLGIRTSTMPTELTTTFSRRGALVGVGVGVGVAVAVAVAVAVSVGVGVGVREAGTDGRFSGREATDSLTLPAGMARTLHVARIAAPETAQRRRRRRSGMARARSRASPN